MGIVNDDLTLLRSAKGKYPLICFVNRIGIILADKFETHLQFFFPLKQFLGGLPGDAQPTGQITG